MTNTLKPLKLRFCRVPPKEEQALRRMRSLAELYALNYECASRVREMPGFHAADRNLWAYRKVVHNNLYCIIITINEQNNFTCLYSLNFFEDYLLEGASNLVEV